MRLRLAAMKAVIAHPHQGIEHAANFRRGLAGAAIAKEREDARKTGIARNAMGISGFLEALEGGENEPRLMGCERSRKDGAENDVGGDMGHLDVDVDRSLPRRGIESCDLRLDRLMHEIEYDLDARLFESRGHHAALAFRN